MIKSILQIETITEEEFTNKILLGVKSVLENFSENYSLNSSDKLLTREETAELLSVSITTLWDWTRKDIIPAYRIGTNVRYKKNEVLEALQKINNSKKQ
ncbi:MAG: helix-turn-helix domain-containing protein [Bacteroidetes bacterium]|uniref:helix-turn-helix domain-containing protein n=1 Tax=Flavobacterium sp. TaxID=239 RepID=UPI002FDA640E|nr:helix-turn-helix domain-containing protein [Bacteroidota bacterium]